MRRDWGIRIAAGVFIVLSIYFGWKALEYPAGGGTFPLFSTGGIVALSVVLILNSFFMPNGSQKIAFDFSFARIKPLLIAALTFVYVIAIFELGYFVSSALFLILSTLFLGIRNYRAIAITAIVLFPAMYAFFVLFLQAQLPTGILI